MTLQLFDVLLHTPLSSVVHQLVLQGGEEPQLMVLQGREELMVPVEHLDTEKQQLQEDVKRCSGHFIKTWEPKSSCTSAMQSLTQCLTITFLLAC